MSCRNPFFSEKSCLIIAPWFWEQTDCQQSKYDDDSNHQKVTEPSSSLDPTFLAFYSYLLSTFNEVLVKEHKLEITFKQWKKKCKDCYGPKFLQKLQLKQWRCNENTEKQPGFKSCC